VAGDAAAGLEQLVAGQFVGVRRLVAQQPLVKARVRGDQGLLEFGDRVGDLVDVDDLFAVDQLNSFT
jgi:hypothetical protein